MSHYYYVVSDDWRMSCYTISAEVIATAVAATKGAQEKWSDEETDDDLGLQSKNENAPLGRFSAFNNLIAFGGRA